MRTASSTFGRFPGTATTGSRRPGSDSLLPRSWCSRPAEYRDRSQAAYRRRHTRARHRAGARSWRRHHGGDRRWRRRAVSRRAGACAPAPVTTASGRLRNSPTRPRLTDDRGRYRLFGLPRGSYLIVASIDARGARRGPFARAGIRAGVLPGHRARRVRAAGAGRARRRHRRSRFGGRRDIDGAGRPERRSTRSGNPVVGRVSLGVSHRSGSVAPEPRVVQVGAEGCVRARGRAAGRLRPAGPGRAWSRHARRVRRRVHHGRRERPAADDDQDVGRRDARGPLRGRGRIESAHACAIDSRRADGPRSRSTGWSWTSRPGRARRWPVLSHGTLRADATDVSCAAGVVSEVADDWRSGRHRQALRLRVRRRDVFADAEIVLSAGATIAGSIADGPGRRDSAFTVVAFSADRTNWFAGSRHLKRASSSSNGSFEVSGLPPGEYFVAAVDTLGPGDWQASNNLEALVQGATRVTVRESQVQTVTLRLRRR